MPYREAIRVLNGIRDEGGWTNSAYNSLTLAIDALEKQIPKKVVKGKDLFWEYQCPNTNCDTQFARHASYAFCPGCGQAIDWSAYK